MRCRNYSPRIRISVDRTARSRARIVGRTRAPIIPGRYAYQDEVVTFVTVPLETPLSALSEFVNQAVQPLFEIFDGFSLSKGVVEDLTLRLIERKL